ncbi:MAG: trehalose-binding protein, partial [Deltaproteobacteria bacterium]
EWPAIRAWFLKEKPKKDQQQQQVLDEFLRAGSNIYSTAKVTVKDSYITSPGKKRSSISLCSSCGEAYRSDLGETCPACQGKSPYL